MMLDGNMTVTGRLKLGSVVPQPLISIVMLIAAVAVVASSWIGGLTGWSRSPVSMSPLIALALLATVLFTFQFPVHVGLKARIHMNSVPLYLMVVLLPPPLAAAAAGVGMVAGEISNMRGRESSGSALATQGARWTLLAFVGSVVANAPVSDDVLKPLPLVGAAIILWAGDILTCPILFTPATGVAPKRVIVSMAREAGVAEGAQYLLGLMGVLLAQKEIWALALLFLPTALVYLAFKGAKQLKQGTRQILESMADTVDLRDPYTGGHSRRVTEMTAGILKELRRTGPESSIIVAAARVHDIGKIGIPDDVLRKEGLLTPREREIMETHPERGAELLTRYPDFALGVDMVRHHHERWDGMGYPNQLKGLDIPFGARLIAVADSFDAMTSDRPYRCALSADHAAAVLRKGRAIQWDPDVVDAFLCSIADRLEESPASLFQVLPDPSQPVDPAVTA